MTSKFHFRTLFDGVKGNKNLLFYLFLLVYGFFLLYIGNHLVIWEDESYSLNTTANSLSKVLSLSYLFEGQPPAYFIILALWRKISYGILFARLSSILFIFLSAFVLDKIVKLIFEKIYSKWAVILFLLNPFTVWASLEIRLYALLILLCLSTIYLLYQIYFYNRTKLKVFYVLVGIVGVYTQYYFVFFIISLSFIILLSKGWRTFFNFCLWSLIIAACFMPNFLFIGDQYAMHQNTQVDISWHSKLSDIFYSPVQFLFAIYTMGWGLLGHWIALLVAGFLFLFLFYNLYNEYKKHNIQEIKTIFEIIVPIISLLIIFAIVFVVSDLVYLLHYLTIIFPFYAILYATIGIFSRRIKAIVYCSFVVYYLFLIFNVYHSSWIKRHDSKSAALYAHRIEHANEPIVFRENTLLLTFKPYYQGNNLLVPVPVRKYDYNYYQNDVKDTTELKQLLENSIGKYESFLLINWDDRYVSIKDLPNTKMDEFLNRHYRITVDTMIDGKEANDYLRVRRLYKK